MSTQAPNNWRTVSKILLIANLLFWIYFGIAFTRASYPYSPEVWNYTAPTAPAGYTFFGHSIGQRESAFQHPFFQTMFFVEFPSFAVARVGQNLLFPSVTGDRVFVGISEGGWRLLVVGLLSFLQWYLVGWTVHKISRRWSRAPSAAPTRAPSTQERG